MSTAIDRHAAFTSEQLAAVTTRGVSISLSAGAGCGKTFVLTERFLDHFDPDVDGGLSPDDIGQVVAITFTDRAAREMRDRIRRKCRERLAAAEPAQAGYWTDLLRAMDNARISTIHSFCAALLRRNAVQAGIDPQFTVLEQAQAETLLTEATDDELRRLIGERDDGTLRLAVEFGLQQAREMARMLVIACTEADYDTWKRITPEEQVASWQEYLEGLPRTLGQALAASHEALEAERLLREHPPTHPKMADRREGLTAALGRLRAGAKDRAALVGDLQAVIDNAKVQGTKPTQWPHEDVFEAFMEIAEDLRGDARGLMKSLDFDPVAARDVAALGGDLLRLAEAVGTAYARRKQELRALDFDDLLRQAHRLLTDESHGELVKQLNAGLTLLLVDEFQDTDPLQTQLIEALCGTGRNGGLERGKLFFVGDPKQSIYRFRGADPSVFRRLRQRTPERGRQKLSENFRSQEGILDFVNALLRDDLGNEFEPLRSRRGQVARLPVVEFLWAPADSGHKQRAEELRAREAEWIARRIAQILDEGEPIVGDAEAARTGRQQVRPARPGDFAILLRALTGVEAYEAALRRHGIDYYLVGGHAFYSQQEVFDLLNLMRTLNSATDVVSLIGALRSGFFSLADETLFWLGQHPGGVAGGLFANELPDQIEPQQRQRAAYAAATIARLRESKDQLRISELIELAFELTGYDAAILNEFLGERKLANLLKLQEQARTFQRGEFFGLADFMAQLSEFVARQPKEALAATHAEDTNVVRLMTVHQAKGLEFPIVIVPDVNRRENDQSPAAHFDAKLGPLVRATEVDGHRPLVGYDLWRMSERAEDAAEMNRLLYVATTRAADYLILSGGVQQIGDSNGTWTKLLGRRFDLASGRCLASLPPEDRVPQVKVTSAAPPARKTTIERRQRIDESLLALAEAAPPAEDARASAVDPIAPDRSARRQYSFSRLSPTLHRRYERLDNLDDGSDVPHDPRGLGTLVHAALAAVDWKKPGDVGKLVERLAEQHLPDSPAEIAEAATMVEKFVASPRARDIAAAKTAHVEVEFLLGWPLGSDAHECVLRGFIDCLYEDACGRWHVLDFKTNRLDGSALESQAAHYEMQMLLYALAAEQTLGQPPSSITLHFLRTGQEHPFAWNAAAREKLIELVNRGIEAAR